MEREKIEEEKKEGGTYIVPALALLQGDSERGRERKRKKKKRTDLIFAACTNFGLHQFTHTKKKKRYGVVGAGSQKSNCMSHSDQGKEKKNRDKTLEEEVKLSFSSSPQLQLYFSLSFLNFLLIKYEQREVKT